MLKPFPVPRSEFKILSSGFLSFGAKIRFEPALGWTFLQAAEEAVRPVNAYYRSALPAGPPFPFCGNELPDSVLPYTLKIFDHAHAVFSPIALIQLLQSFTGIDFTIEAVRPSCFLKFIAVPDNTLPGIVGCACMPGHTSATPVLLPPVSNTEGAIHPAGRYHHPFNQIRSLWHGLLCRFFHFPRPWNSRNPELKTRTYQPSTV